MDPYTILVWAGTLCGVSLLTAVVIVVALILYVELFRD